MEYIQRNTKTKNKFLIEKFNKKDFQHIYFSRCMMCNTDGAIHIKMNIVFEYIKKN